MSQPQTTEQNYFDVADFNMIASVLNTHTAKHGAFCSLNALLRTLLCYVAFYKGGAVVHAKMVRLIADSLSAIADKLEKGGTMHAILSGEPEPDRKNVN